MTLREGWLAGTSEPIIDPGRRIIDPHHHFFQPGGQFPAYDLDDLWRDTAGHGVEQTVFLQCWEGYRDDGPEALRCVGETEWVDSIAARAREHPERAQIGAIIGSTELRMGADVRRVLEAHVASSLLFRGIRQAVAWDSDPDILSMPEVEVPNLYDDADFRAGFAVLDDMGLVFDSYQYHHQLPSLTRLAEAFPGVTIVLDHLGTPLGVGPYTGRGAEIFTQWCTDMTDLARCPNVVVKLGGLAMPWNGYGFEHGAMPPTSDEVVERQGAWYRHAIEAFGPERCMFESNFPVDKLSLSYNVLWNAFKKMAADYSDGDKALLFAGTAERVYRLRGVVDDA